MSFRRRVGWIGRGVATGETIRSESNQKPTHSPIIADPTVLRRPGWQYHLSFLGSHAGPLQAASHGFPPCSDPCILSPTAKPRILVNGSHEADKLLRVTAKAGDEVTLDCEAQGSPPPLVTWTKDSAPCCPSPTGNPATWPRARGWTELDVWGKLASRCPVTQLVCRTLWTAPGGIATDSSGSAFHPLASKGAWMPFRRSGASVK